MNPGNRVLIVGGYGHVGQRISRLLSEELGTRLVIGGRHRSRAQSVASEFGGRSRVIDCSNPTTFPAALDKVAIVVVCVDITSLSLAQACLTRGIHYIDISASYEVIERLVLLHDLARAHRVTIVSSVGLAPGLTNLLAKACVNDAPDPVTDIKIHVLLGLGDQHGRAAMEWMVDRLHRPFTVTTGGGARRVIPFAETSTVQLPPPYGNCTTYRFDLSDQHTLPQTLGVKSVSTWCTFDRAWLGARLHRLAQRSRLAWLQHAWLRRLLILSLRLFRQGSSQFVLCVEATAETTESRTLIRRTAHGFGEADVTAVMAAETVRKLLADRWPTGVFQLDELFTLDEYSTSLTANGVTIDAPELIDGNHRTNTSKLNGHALYATREASHK